MKFRHHPGIVLVSSGCNGEVTLLAPIQDLKIPECLHCYETITNDWLRSMVIIESYVSRALLRPRSLHMKNESAEGLIRRRGAHLFA